MKKMFLVVVLALLAACTATPADTHVHEDPTLEAFAPVGGSNPGLSHTYGGPTPNGHRGVSLARSLSRTYVAGSNIPAGSSVEIDLVTYHYLTSARVTVGPSSRFFPISCQWLDKTVINSQQVASKMRCSGFSGFGQTYTVNVDEQNPSGTWVNVLYNTYTVDANLQP